MATGVDKDIQIALATLVDAIQNGHFTLAGVVDNLVNYCVPNGNGTKGGKEKMPRQRLYKYGEGGVTKRTETNKKGTVRIWYEARYTDEYGKRRCKTFKTKATADQELSQFNKRKTTRETKNRQVTFGEKLKEWYDECRRADCGKERNANNDLMIERIPKHIMTAPARQVTHIMLQKHVNSIPDKSPKHESKQLLKAFTKYAFLNGIIENDIGHALKADMPKAPEKPILPRERENEYFDLLGNYKGYGIGLAYTGTRLAEFIRLNENWKTDIDYENEIVKIRETKSLRQSDIRNGTTYVMREIPLLPELAALKFPLPVVKQKTVNKNFAKASKQFGINLTPHCMRHTFVSRCNEYRIAPSVIRGMTGHKTDKMLNHYTHNTNELKEREYARLKNATPIPTPICTADVPTDTENDAKVVIFTA